MQDKIIVEEINAFKVLGVSEKFDIDHLDQIYFEQYKKFSSDISKLQEINKAYLILKDPIERVRLLCHLYGYYEIDSSIAQEVFSIILCSEYEIENLGEELYQSIIENARMENWLIAWKFLQKYMYVKKMRQNNLVKN